MADEQFYASLPEIEAFAEIADRDRYSDVPDSWQLIITDVKGSTAAIEAGRYRDVNAVGVASIVALRNAIPDLEIPFVFGGDGATMLAPEVRIEAARAALRGACRLAREAFDLTLLAGVVRVAELRAEGHPVRIARLRISPNVCLAMLAGDGIAAAEKRIKDPALSAPYLIGSEGDATVSFEGFECRWNPVKSRRGFMVSLLVLALPESEAAAAAVYREVIDLVERVARPDTARPVSADGLRLKGALDDFEVESRVRSGAKAGPTTRAAQKIARKKSLIGKMLIGLGTSAGGFDGRQYKDELVANTDFRKFDQMLRMVLDLSREELDALRSDLERRRDTGELAFGIHCSAAALVTCHVRSYAGDHLHFIDGSDGGYALAAKQLKAQLRAPSGGSRGVLPPTRLR